MGGGLGEEGAVDVGQGETGAACAGEGVRGGGADSCVFCQIYI